VTTDEKKIVILCDEETSACLVQLKRENWNEVRKTKKKKILCGKEIHEDQSA
jgi:hypothetical protein